MTSQGFSVSCPGTGLLGLLLFTVGMGRPQSSFLGQHRHPSGIPLPPVMSMPCASAASGGKNSLQGDAGSFAAGSFKLFPGRPEISSILIHYGAARLCLLEHSSQLPICASLAVCPGAIALPGLLGSSVASSFVSPHLCSYS